jgi:hypothetical protein
VSLSKKSEKKQKKPILEAKKVDLEEKRFEGIKINTALRWDRTNDVQGHKPKWNIECVHCKYTVDNPWMALKYIWYYFFNKQRLKPMPMALRHSTLTGDKDSEGRDANIMCYKCPRCAWFITFYVMDDSSYLSEIRDKYREGYRKFIPSIDDWSDESEEIARQLEALGYFGGR